MKKKNTGGIIINPYCDYDCLFCNGREKASKEEIKEQERKIYKNLESFKKEEIERISISGADPIEYNHISELVNYIKKDFKTVRISTHGEKLKNKELADKLIEAGLDELRIPIYGSKPSIHDSVTGKEGSFKNTLDGIKYLKKQTNDIEFKITTLIVKNNKNDLINIIDLLDSLNIKSHTFSVPAIADGNYSFYIPFKDLSPYVKKIYKYQDQVDTEIDFIEIPYCVFETIDLKIIKNKTAPPNLGKHNQPPKQHKTDIPDLPAYRLKKKIKMCSNCKASKNCDGFFVNDIDKFGAGDLKPIK